MSIEQTSAPETGAADHDSALARIEAVLAEIRAEHAAQIAELGAALAGVAAQVAQMHGWSAEAYALLNSPKARFARRVGAL